MILTERVTEDGKMQLPLLACEALNLQGDSTVSLEIHGNKLIVKNMTGGSDWSELVD